MIYTIIYFGWQWQMEAWNLTLFATPTSLVSKRVVRFRSLKLSFFRDLTCSFWCLKFLMCVCFFSEAIFFSRTFGETFLSDFNACVGSNHTHTRNKWAVNWLIVPYCSCLWETGFVLLLAVVHPFIGWLASCCLLLSLLVEGDHSKNTTLSKTLPTNQLFFVFSEGGANWCFLQLESYEAQASNQWDEWHSERCGHFQVQRSSTWETCRSLFVICIHGSLQGRVEGWNKSGVAIVSSILANTHRPTQWNTVSQKIGWHPNNVVVACRGKTVANQPFACCVVVGGQNWLVCFCSINCNKQNWNVDVLVVSWFTYCGSWMMDETCKTCWQCWKVVLVIVLKFVWEPYSNLIWCRLDPIIYSH